MQPGWKQRLVVWLSVAESARANRAAFPQLPTAWLPHLLGNSVVLWLPELLALVDQRMGARPEIASSVTGQGIRDSLRTLVIKNRDWVSYVTPLALGYALSHPRITIYSGGREAIRVAGMGLDAIPHAATAFALSRLVQDGLHVLDRSLSGESPLAPLVAELARWPRATSALALTVATLLWEVGEYRVQQIELEQMGGDRSAINMQWSVTDMLHDTIANLLGWAAAGVVGPMRDA